MKAQKQIWKILGLTTLYSLALTLVPKISHGNEPLSVQSVNDYQVAQINNCREVDVNSMLNIRRQPNGEVIGALENEQTVSVVGEPQNGWVQINTPMNGYVAARYLEYCVDRKSVV